VTHAQLTHTHVCSMINVWAEYCEPSLYY